jgi:hypothetical protein
MASSIMGGLPHDIIRQIILESTREERMRKDTLDYWTSLWAEGGKPVRVQYKALKEVHNHMKQVTLMGSGCMVAQHESAQESRDAHPQADKGKGVMWRRVWWSRKSSASWWHRAAHDGIAGIIPRNIADEWHSLLRDR